MIKTWANRSSQRFYEDGKTAGFRGIDIELALSRLAALDAAESLNDLGALRSVGLHKLSGDRAGLWAITVSGRWRICFRFRGGNAYDVEIVDYHRG